MVKNIGQALFDSALALFAAGVIIGGIILWCTGAKADEPATGYPNPNPPPEPTCSYGTGTDCPCPSPHTHWEVTDQACVPDDEDKL